VRGAQSRCRCGGEPQSRCRCGKGEPPVVSARRPIGTADHENLVGRDEAATDSATRCNTLQGAATENENLVDRGRSEAFARACMLPKT
jgi:hypothetical protein